MDHQLQTTVIYRRYDLEHLQGNEYWKGMERTVTDISSNWQRIWSQYKKISKQKLILDGEFGLLSSLAIVLREVEDI